MEGNAADERALKAELQKAEVALKRSKTKDYYKILGECLMFFLDLWMGGYGMELTRGVFGRCTEGLLRFGYQEGLSARIAQTPSRQGTLRPSTSLPIFLSIPMQGGDEEIF